jgi:hypothetical protein
VPSETDRGEGGCRRCSAGCDATRGSWGPSMTSPEEAESQGRIGSPTAVRPTEGPLIRKNVSSMRSRFLRAPGLAIWLRRSEHKLSADACRCPHIIIALHKIVYKRTNFHRGSHKFQRHLKAGWSCLCSFEAQCVSDDHEAREMCPMLARYFKIGDLKLLGRRHFGRLVGSSQSDQLAQHFGQVESYLEDSP